MKGEAYAAEALDIEPARLAKTLVAAVDGDPVFVLVPGDLTRRPEGARAGGRRQGRGARRAARRRAADRLPGRRDQPVRLAQGAAGVRRAPLPGARAGCVERRRAGCDPRARARRPGARPSADGRRSGALTEQRRAASSTRRELGGRLRRAGPAAGRPARPAEDAAGGSAAGGQCDPERTRQVDLRRAASATRRGRGRWTCGGRPVRPGEDSARRAKPQHPGPSVIRRRGTLRTRGRARPGVGSPTSLGPDLRPWTVRTRASDAGATMVRTSKTGTGSASSAAAGRPALAQRLPSEQGATWDPWSGAAL